MGGGRVVVWRWRGVEECVVLDAILGVLDVFLVGE